ncbi:MAG: Z-ring formation inhibitor MciZ [Clostridia bacterium]|nr:Z-ring formation inhibitor MciZ [Clostridia bacterium]
MKHYISKNKLFIYGKMPEIINRLKELSLEYTTVKELLSLYESR